MAEVMGLNADIVINGDEDTIPLMKQARGNAKNFVGVNHRSVETLPPCSWVEQGPELYKNSQRYTDINEVPSVELGCIWNGKFSMLMQSMKEHPDYDHYIWMDVGIHDPKAHVLLKHANKRDKLFPNPSTLERLPKDKMTVTHSYRTHKGYTSCKECTEWKYCHCVAGTAYSVPKSLLPQMDDLFSQYLRQCFEDTRGADTSYTCMSDQVVLSRIARDHPDLFEFVDGPGYGAVATYLVSD